MYRSAVILIIAFVLLVLMLIVAMQTLVVTELLAVIDEHAGAVQVVRGAQARAAEAGMLVRAGERIRTGADGRVGLHWADGSRVELGPDSEFVIQRCRLNKASRCRQSRFRLNLGEVWVRMRGAMGPKSKFEVETPTILAAVRGTIFGIKVSPDGTTRLQVYRGEVDILSNGLGQAVASGGCATVGRGGFHTRRMSEDEQQCWREMTCIVGPLLKIAEPGPGVTTTSVPLAPVRGCTEAAASVSINGERVKVNYRGIFRGRVRLVEGRNTITVVASMGEMRTVIERQVIYANPTQEIVLTSRPSADPHDAPGVMGITAVVRNGGGELAPDGTPVELAADRGTVERLHRTSRGVVNAKWRPDGAQGQVRVTARSGAARATIVMTPPSSSRQPSQ